MKIGVAHDDPNESVHSLSVESNNRILDFSNGISQSCQLVRDELPLLDPRRVPDRRRQLPNLYRMHREPGRSVFVPECEEVIENRQGLLTFVSCFSSGSTDEVQVSGTVDTEESTRYAREGSEGESGEMREGKRDVCDLCERGLEEGREEGEVRVEEVSSVGDREVESGEEEDIGEEGVDERANEREGESAKERRRGLSRFGVALLRCSRRMPLYLVLFFLICRPALFRPTRSLVWFR